MRVGCSRHSLSFISGALVPFAIAIRVLSFLFSFPKMLVAMKLYGQILTRKWKPSSPFLSTVVIIMMIIIFPLFLGERLCCSFRWQQRESIFDSRCAGEWWRVVCPTTIDGQASRRNVYINALLHETTHTADAYPAQRWWWWWRQMKKAKKKQTEIHPPKKKYFAIEYVCLLDSLFLILRKIKYEEIAAYFSIFSYKPFVLIFFF